MLKSFTLEHHVDSSSTKPQKMQPAKRTVNSHHMPDIHRELKLTRMVSFSNDSNIGPGHNPFKFL